MNPRKKNTSQDARRSLEAQDVQLTKLRQSLEDAIASHAAYKALKKCGEGTLGESWRFNVEWMCVCLKMLCTPKPNG